jgi:hypothetical protein
MPLLDWRGQGILAINTSLGPRGPAPSRVADQQRVANIRLSCRESPPLIDTLPGLSGDNNCRGSGNGVTRRAVNEAWATVRAQVLVRPASLASKDGRRNVIVSSRRAGPAGPCHFARRERRYSTPPTRYDLVHGVEAILPRTRRGKDSSYRWLVLGDGSRIAPSLRR